MRKCFDELFQTKYRKKKKKEKSAIIRLAFISKSPFCFCFSFLVYREVHCDVMLSILFSFIFFSFLIMTVCLLFSLSVPLKSYICVKPALIVDLYVKYVRQALFLSPHSIYLFAEPTSALFDTTA